MNPSGCLDGRVVVTGASQRLGVAFARAVHEAGAAVAVAAAARTVEALAEELGDSRAVAVGCDVTAAADRERLVTAAETGTRR